MKEWDGLPDIGEGGWLDWMGDEHWGEDKDAAVRQR